eukprot:CAMPEP_0119466806 /NCGR_PEP_ID=MMETSP1344-20130328/1289_1 /TAXON_ID=236787 /ORGANISM="Florenciella parvula, Strain CCMP2471" /LENGTH=58 /DNA_ID=CAMNT_0007499137 /DNA_START=517 /DNA_END=690 /DNA_ORIENTATION=-
MALKMGGTLAQGHPWYSSIVHACPPANVDATATPVRSSCTSRSSVASIATVRPPAPPV